MSDAQPQNERREFLRVSFKTPVEYKSVSLEKSSATAPKSVDQKAFSKNISQSGILFQTSGNPPQLSSILWMNLDIRTLNICQEIEKRALVHGKGILGRVVRVEESAQDGDKFDVGVCFITQDQKDSREVKKALSEIA